MIGPGVLVLKLNIDSTTENQVNKTGNLTGSRNQFILAARTQSWGKGNCKGGSDAKKPNWASQERHRINGGCDTDWRMAKKYHSS